MQPRAFGTLLGRPQPGGTRSATTLPLTRAMSTTTDIKFGSSVMVKVGNGVWTMWWGGRTSSDVGWITGAHFVKALLKDEMLADKLKGMPLDECAVVMLTRAAVPAAGTLPAPGVEADAASVVPDYATKPLETALVEAGCQGLMPFLHVRLPGIVSPTRLTLWARATGKAVPEPLSATFTTEAQLQRLLGKHGRLYLAQRSRGRPGKRVGILFTLDQAIEASKDATKCLVLEEGSGARLDGDGDDDGVASA